MNSEHTKKKQKIFDVFVARLADTYRNFCVWKSLQKAEYNLTYQMNNYFWLAVLDSGNMASLMELSKLVERDERSNNLSIFTLLESQLDDMEDILGKIKKARNKNWAHLDFKTMLDQNGFYKELGLKWGEIEKVFEKLFETLDNIKKLFNEKNGTNYQKYFKDIRERCEGDVERFMKKVKASAVRE